jgi:hypothetical protein
MKRVARAAHGMMEASSENRTHRAVSILLVLILHVLPIFALLRFMVRPQNSPFRMMLETHLSEMIVNTARPTEPRTRKEAPKPAPARAAAQHVPQNLAPSEPLTHGPNARSGY